MSFIYNIPTAWTDALTVYNGIMLDATNGAGGSPVYAAGTKLFNLKNNGTSVFSVSPTGGVIQTNAAMTTGEELLAISGTAGPNVGSIVMTDFILDYTGSTLVADSGAGRFVARHISGALGISLRAGEGHVLKFAGVPAAGAWAWEFGTHSEVAGNTVSTNLGLYLASSHLGWTPTGVRNDTAILITGEDGWYWAYKYYDTDGVTILSDLSQTGVLRVAGGLNPTTSNVNIGVAASARWGNVYLDASKEINFNNSNVRILHAASALSITGTTNGITLAGNLIPNVSGQNIGVAATARWGSIFMDLGSELNWGNSNIRWLSAAATFAMYGMTNGLFIDVGGLIVGSLATGGNKGTGTINVSVDIYKNNTAYTNPDFVLEKYFTGKIDKFKDREGAASYSGLMDIKELKEYAKNNFRLPNISDEPSGMFERGDKALEKIEELTLYLFDAYDRIEQLEQRTLQ